MAEPKSKPIDRWLGLGSIVVGVLLYLLPKTPLVVVGSLVAILLLLLHPTWNFWWIEKSIWRRLALLIILSGGLVGIGYYVWPTVPERTTSAPTGTSATPMQSAAPAAGPAAAQNIVTPLGQATHSKSSRQLKLIFKDSPLFTQARKERLTDQLEAFFGYLTGVGFDPPKQVPPIEVMPGRRGLSRLSEDPATPYGGYLRIGELSIDDSQGIIKLYANYAFDTLLSPVLHDTIDFQTPTEWIFGDYYTCSYLGSYTYSASEDGLNKWRNALWDIRQKCGKDFTDTALFYTFKRLEPRYIKSESFDDFFANRFRRGLMVRANLFEIREDVLEILKRHGLAVK